MLAPPAASRKPPGGPRIHGRRRRAPAIALTCLASACAPRTSTPGPARWEAGPALPRPVANNAVAAGPGPTLYSLMGLSANKTWAGIVRDAWQLQLEPGTAWRALPRVPGSAGRLAATAQVVGGRLYLFGGYTVAPDGKEHSSPRVDVFDPARGAWTDGPAMPLPVDDTMSAVWQDRFIVLVSGWHEDDNVADVQLLDTHTGRWISGSPIPGAPVFGHAGAVTGNVVVYCDGVAVDRDRQPAFFSAPGCTRGDLNPARPGEIVWREATDHPGPPRYRMAAAATPAGRIVFAGGSPNPYNFNGVGYDGVPSPATAEVYAYDPEHDGWSSLPPLPAPRMDHRGLAVTPDALWLIGGMGPEQSVVATTWRLAL